MRASAGLVVILAGCAAARPVVASPAEAAPAGETVAPPDPCAGLDGLVLTPPAEIPARWDGRGVMIGGEAPLDVRWCGEGEVVVETITLGPPEGEARVRYDFAPEHGRLAHGASLTRMLRGWAEPQTLRVHVLARRDGAVIEASADTRSVEDPAFVAARTECEAAHGSFGPVGLAGSLGCTRPTRDAGQRCLSSAECEGACIDDHVEVVDAAPDGRTCPAPETMRLHVGRCDTHVPHFGCAPRLSEVLAECVRAGMTTRSHSVCVD